ncbi:Outer membrane receptor proteins, mostly Fe transport [Chitinophaga sp. YR627]|uniref:outer membrane beta-barrel family protein n=1 Tax=Chitinophaga sp. YR627 TaxID=1881041 RepID=UPI0008E69FCA|nr:outer membrane beta-barrel family protein [Chitinophaga sp. YR627]SFO73273.1 Outer membrane receptor proteins, mostly Fe transport [Chitinophaga sp. YR627]
MKYKALYVITTILCLGQQTVEAQQADTLRRHDLQAFTVNAAAPVVTMKTGKILLNIADSKIAAGGDALQVLTLAPGVIERGNGQYELYGKKVTVLVDGKDSRLSGDALKGWLSALPAGSIEKVELITNPSARYDAAGAAVINIITVKNKRYGLNGVLTAGVGMGRYGRYNGGLALNYRNEKMNIYANYDYLYNKQYYDLRSDRYADNKATITQNSYETRVRYNHSFKGGIDFDVNKRSSAGIMFKGLLIYRDRAMDTRSEKEDALSVVATTGHLRVLNPAVNAWYKVNLDTMGRQLTVNADYFNYNKAWKDDYITTYFETNNRTLKNPWLLRDNSPSDNTILSLALDYSQPLWKGKLEAGIKTTATLTDNNVLWEQQTGKTWQTDSGKTNHFIYRENIHAGYLDYQRTIRQWELRAGLRAEHATMQGESVTLRQHSKRSQFNIFPSFSLVYGQSGNHQYGFAYRKNIERFSFSIVNPFLTYVSQYFYYQGNPDIRPSIGHTFELSYTYRNELFATLGYQHYAQVLTDVYRKDTGNVVISTFENLKGASTASASLSWSKGLLGNKWQTTSAATLTYTRYAEINTAGAGMYASSANTFALPGGFAGELTANWYSPVKWATYRMKARYSVNAGISKSILHKAGRLTFNVTDIFNTFNAAYDVASFGVISTHVDKIESRFIKLVFSYKFGNQQVKAAVNRKTGIEKELRRIGG